MRFFKLDNKEWPCGVSDGLVLPCAICGEEDIKFDYVVTDKLWDMIVPKEIRRDVVCLPCLDKLAKEKHADLGSNMESLQFTGTNVTIEFLPCNIFYYNKEYDFEVEATPDTLCGRLGQKHKMKRIHHSKTVCIYPGCDGCC